MNVEVRPIVEDELDRYMELCQIAFGGKPEEGEAERIRETIGLARAFAAFDRGRMIGTEGAYSLHLTVPGNSPTGGALNGPESAGRPLGVATAGLTRVSAAATHRRRGVLTAMIAAHLADATERGEALSALWASELPIYGRFGYGPASDALRVSFDARRAGLRPPDDPDEVAYAEGDEATHHLPALREHARLAHPGHFHRTETWWKLHNFADHEFWRNGASPLRTVIAWRDGSPVGYTTFRQNPHWTDEDLPDGTVRVIEVAGIDLRARHSLWWFLANVDLHPNVSFWSLPPDSELWWLVTDQRAVTRHLTDGLQLRVLDVVAALEGRSWVQPGTVTFRLTDRHHPTADGTYRLAATGDGTARVERTDDEPELDLQPAALGALYLGSRAADSLAVAGWLTGGSDARQRADRLFRWPVAAWCDEMF